MQSVVNPIYTISFEQDAKDSLEIVLEIGCKCTHRFQRTVLSALVCLHAALDYVFNTFEIILHFYINVKFAALYDLMLYL